MYASKTKSDLPKSNGKTTSNNSPRSSDVSSNLTIQLTSDTTKPPGSTQAIPSLAGDDVAMTPVSWKPWSQEIEKEAMTRRKRWKHWHFTGFFRTSWMSRFFHMYHWMLFYTPCTVSSLSSSDLAQGSIATHEIAKQKILLVKAVPISQHQIHTRYKKLRHIAYCFSIVDGTGRCYAIMPSLIRYLWSLKTTHSPWFAKLRCAPGSRRHRVPSQCGGFSFLQNTKQLKLFLSGEWGVFVWSDVSILLKITAMATTNSQNISQPNPRDQNAGSHRIPTGAWRLGLGWIRMKNGAIPWIRAPWASEHNWYKKGRQDNLTN